jgi:hypothetical protein
MLSRFSELRQRIDDRFQIGAAVSLGGSDANDPCQKSKLILFGRIVGQREQVYSAKPLYI